MLRDQLAADVIYDPDTDSWLYAGPLEAGKAAAAADRHSTEGITTTGRDRVYEVLLCDRKPATWATAREFGRCPNGRPEQAWRYALGAYLAPQRARERAA